MDWLRGLERWFLCFTLLIMTVGEGIAAAQLAMKAGKEAIDLLRTPSIDGEAVRHKLIEMQDLIFSSQRALSEAEEENRRLKRQLEDRDDLRALEADMAFLQDGAFYVRKSEWEHGVMNPLCPICWGEHKKAIPLVPMANGYYQCATHKSSYRTQAYKDEMERKMRANYSASNGGPNSWMG